MAQSDISRSEISQSEITTSVHDGLPPGQRAVAMLAVGIAISIAVLVAGIALAILYPLWNFVNVIN